MRGRFGPCATRQIFVRGQFAPGKDVPGHRAQSPKLRTLVTSEFISSREVQSFRACGKDVCGQSSTIITSDRLSSPTPSFVVLSSQRLHPLPRPWNPANELSPTISPHREDHPTPFRGWRGTKAGSLGIRNSLDRRQKGLYKGTIPH